MGCPNSFPHCALLQVPKAQPVALITSPEDSQHYEEARQCVEELALYLKPLSNTRGTYTQTRLLPSELRSSFIMILGHFCCLQFELLRFFSSWEIHKYTMCSLGVEVV